MAGAVNGAAQMPLARREQRMRALAAGVAERVQPPALGTHHEHTLTSDLAAQIIARRAQLRLVTEHLPRGPQQQLTLGGEQRRVRIGARRQPVSAAR